MKKSCLAFLLLCVSDAHAYCPRPTPKVCSEFFTSDAVFVGMVVSAESVPEHDAGDGWLYRLRVMRSLRGNLGATAQVHTPNDSSRLTLDVGRTYLLFAVERDGRLEISDDCGPLSDPAHLTEVLQEIEKLEDATDASVEGEVRQEGSDRGVPGVAVTVSGVGTVFRDTTDANGLFHIALPPGHYHVDVHPSAAVVWDLNLVDLKNVELAPGECAQILFIAP